MIEYQKELNKEQLQVVTQGDGPCLVLAGAGSGKTRTITYRVAYLLEQGTAPEEILLVTFTNKASKEMLERVAELTKGEIRLPWSGTFHHIGYRILRKYAPYLGYTNNFTILDSEDSRDLIKLSLKVEGIDRKQRRFPSAKVLQSIISYARNAETTIADVLDLKHPNFIDVGDTIARIAEDYAKRKREANAMDFDDLLVNLKLLLLKEAKVRETFATQFKYVMVDEYQDTNKIQASIVEQFASHHNNILVVGDDAQSIYSFRAANIKNILDFEKRYGDAQVFRLEVNYRSTPEILAVANNVIANNVNQYEKELRSVKKTFTKPEVHSFVDQQEEARAIADRILELRDEGIAFDKMAVLFRAAYHSQALEVELTRRDIPYEFRGGVRFFERAHIKDVLAYLRIVNNVQDTVAWSRVLNMQVGIGPATAQKIVSRVQALESIAGIAHAGAGISARAQSGWSDFLSIWESMQAVAEQHPATLIRAIIDSRYATYLENEHPDYKERIQDLEQLALFAERTTELTRFLGEASLQESYAGAKAQTEYADDEPELVLSTIHQAKGLEWDAVFVLNLAQGQFPVDRYRKPGELEEERRLFYVAVTRARKHLHLSYPLSGGYNSFLQGPSVFLEEIQKELLDLYAGLMGESTVFIDPSDDVDDISYEPLDDGPQVRSFLKGLDEL